MELSYTSSEHYNIKKLSMILNYELSTAALYFLSYGGWITVYIAAIAAGIFTPYMLYILFKEKKRGWLISFFVIVIVPLIICILLGLKFGNLNALILLPISFFYFYCFVLKLSVNEYSKELTAREELQKKRDEKKISELAASEKASRTFNI